MSRIVYMAVSGGGIAGGHKMIIRHVETLRELGFDAACYTNPKNVVPSWFKHDAPFLIGGGLKSGDIIVVPDDETPALRDLVARRYPVVVFAQNPYYAASSGGLDAIAAYPPEKAPPVIAVAPRLAATFRRAFPDNVVEIVPCFADERLFRPTADKAAEVALVPRKRPVEAAAIQAFYRRLIPGRLQLDWRELKGATEEQVAQAFARAGLFLSLSHLESVGMTPLEAMASGCLVAGFTGVGGEAYATPENGFWVPSEDCEAAADALARAADIFLTGGPELARRREAGFETARQWSHARFRDALEEVWMRLAPQARVRSAASA
ncbi:glycosyltransferase [Phenylobacterium sp.]|uniref:glycosyltransferase n=1 Tax=Phenylobacterium sp. TaxID=1871053 RepID=UPI0035B2A2A2